MKTSQCVCESLTCMEICSLISRAFDYLNHSMLFYFWFFLKGLIMSLNLLDLAKSSLAPILLSKAGALFGLDNHVASKSLDAIFPTLLSGILNQSSTPQGASGLLNAIKDPSVDANILHNLPNVLASESGVHSLGAQGGKILGLLFGDKVNGLGEQMAHIAGAPAEAVTGIKGLTALVAPALFGMLKNQVVTNNLNANGFSNLLANQVPHLQKSLPAQIADWLGWGSVAGFFGSLASKFGGALGDLTSGTLGAASAVGGAAAAGGKSALGFLKWLLPLLVLGAIALWALKSCSGTPTAPTVSTAPVVNAASNAASSAANTVSNAGTAAVGAVKNIASDVASVFVENGVVKFYFASGKSDLAKDTNTALTDIVKGVQAGQKVVISGYHDSTGNATQNAALAKKRAENVRDALIALGVSADKVELKKPETTQGGGTGDNPEARRVEVQLVK